MKYKIKQGCYFTSSEIHKETPCKGEFNKFVKKYGWTDPIHWNEETEKYMESQNEWIPWLCENGFIEQIKKYFVGKKIAGDNGDEYILAGVCGKVCLISLRCGIYWREPVYVKNFANITEEEMNEIKGSFVEKEVATGCFPPGDF